MAAAAAAAGIKLAATAAASALSATGCCCCGDGLLFSLFLSPPASSADTTDLLASLSAADSTVLADCSVSGELGLEPSAGADGADGEEAVAAPPPFSAGEASLALGV